MKKSKNLIGVPSIDRGVPGQGVVVEGVKLGKKALMPAEIPEKGAPKIGGFPALSDLKIAETPFFTQKYLLRYTPTIFFEEYINFTIFR